MSLKWGVYGTNIITLKNDDYVRNMVFFADNNLKLITKRNNLEDFLHSLKSFFYFLDWSS